jgi:uncharacterized protein YqjF (DUF2071 family)
VTIDRETIRCRPSDEKPLQFQTWADLAFIHWPFPPEAVRSLVPRELELDLFDGQAWVGIVPFTMRGIRARGLPPIPGLSAFHELNVRTYVHANGVPGVWFFSLDAANAVAVWAARRFYRLPYFRAEMSLEHGKDRMVYASRRTHRNAPAAHLHAVWRIGDVLPSPDNGSLPFFLAERYSLYTMSAGGLRRCRVWHRPWVLRSAELESLDSTMLQAAGLPPPAGDALIHHAGSLDVEIFKLLPADTEP